MHVKDHVDHVRVCWIMETLRHIACIVGWVVRLSQLAFPRKATQSSHGRNPSGTIQLLKKKKGGGERKYLHIFYVFRLTCIFTVGPIELSITNIHCSTSEKRPTVEAEGQEGCKTLYYLAICPCTLGLPLEALCHGMRIDE